jgi:hypothetical protein
MKPEEQIQGENRANTRLGWRSEWSTGGYSLQLTMGGKIIAGTRRQSSRDGYCRVLGSLDPEKF